MSRRLALALCGSVALAFCGERRCGAREVGRPLGRLGRPLASTARGGDEAIDPAIASCLANVRSAPRDAEAWLRLGVGLWQLGEFAEAERVFAESTERCGPNDMLGAALQTLRGHSHHYHRGSPRDESAPPPNNNVEFQEDNFDSYLVGGDSIKAHRTVAWGPSAAPPAAYVSRAPLLQKDECAFVIAAAERAAAKNGGWGSARHAKAATTDVALKDVPEVLEWFNRRLEDTLFPMLARLYPTQIKSPDQIRAHDAFIVKYDEHAQRSLATHIDDASFSLTIALNDRGDYVGGGTRFERARQTGEWAPMVLNADAGGVICFPGTAPHGGAELTKGTRYIIPLFCYLDANFSEKRPGYVLDLL